MKLAKKKDNPSWSFSAEIIVADYIWYMIDLQWNMSAICGIYIWRFYIVKKATKQPAHIRPCIPKTHPKHMGWHQCRQIIFHWSSGYDRYWQEYTCHMSASASAALLGACLVSQVLFAAAPLHLLQIFSVLATERLATRGWGHSQVLTSYTWLPLSNLTTISKLMTTYSRLQINFFYYSLIIYLWYASVLLIFYWLFTHSDIPFLWFTWNILLIYLWLNYDLLLIYLWLTDNHINNICFTYDLLISHLWLTYEAIRLSECHPKKIKQKWNITCSVMKCIWNMFGIFKYQ